MSRVIALENETVTYMDDVLYRNDIIVTENYLKRLIHKKVIQMTLHWKP